MAPNPEPDCRRPVLVAGGSKWAGLVGQSRPGEPERPDGPETGKRPQGFSRAKEGHRRARSLAPVQREPLLTGALRRFPVSGPGQRNNQLHRLVCSMIYRGIPASTVRRVALAWRDHWHSHGHLSGSTKPTPGRFLCFQRSSRSFSQQDFGTSDVGSGIHPGRPVSGCFAAALTPPPISSDRPTLFLRRDREHVLGQGPLMGQAEHDPSQSDLEKAQRSLTGWLQPLAQTRLDHPRPQRQSQVRRQCHQQHQPRRVAGSVT